MGKSSFLMVKSTMSMAMFNSYVSLPEGTRCYKVRTQNLVNPRVFGGYSIVMGLHTNL